MLDDARGEVARGLECVEFACGIPHLLKGSHSSEVSTRHRRAHRAAAGRRGGRHHAVQLPGDGAAVDAGQRRRLRQRLRAQAVREGSVGRRCSWPSWCSEAGFPDGVLQRRPGRRRGGRRAARRTPTSTRCRSWAAPPVARHVYETGTAPRQAGPGAGRREEPHGGAARRRPRRGRRRRDLRRLRLGRRALHGHLGGRGRGRQSPTRWSTPSRRASPTSWSARATTPASMMGPLITARAPRPGPLLRRPGAADEGATVVVDGTAGRPQPGDGFFVGCSLLDGVEPGMRGLRRRDLRTGAERRARRHLRRRGGAGQRQPVRQRRRAVHPRRRRGPALRARGRRSAWSASTCPIPVPVASHSFGGWKASLFGDTPIYGPEGIRFYTRPKVVTSRWPDPASSVIDLGLPDQPLRRDRREGHHGARRTFGDRHRRRGRPRRRHRCATSCRSGWGWRCSTATPTAAESWPRSSVTAPSPPAVTSTTTATCGAAIEAARSLGPLSLVVNVAGGGVGGGRTVGRGARVHDKDLVRRHHGDERVRHVQRQPARGRGHGRQRARRRRPARRDREHRFHRRPRGPDRPDRLRGGEGRHPRHDAAHGARPRADRGAGVRDRARAPWARRSCWACPRRARTSWSRTSCSRSGWAAPRSSRCWWSRSPATPTSTARPSASTARSRFPPK